MNRIASIQARMDKIEQRLPQSQADRVVMVAYDIPDEPLPWVLVGLSKPVWRPMKPGDEVSSACKVFTGFDPRLPADGRSGGP